MHPNDLVLYTKAVHQERRSTIGSIGHPLWSASTLTWLPPPNPAVSTSLRVEKGGEIGAGSITLGIGGHRVYYSAADACGNTQICTWLVSVKTVGRRRRVPCPLPPPATASVASQLSPRPLSPAEVPRPQCFMTSRRQAWQGRSATHLPRPTTHATPYFA
jgi:hypothetical protein